MTYKLWNIYKIKNVYLKELLLYPNVCDIKISILVDKDCMT